LKGTANVEDLGIGANAELRETMKAPPKWKTAILIWLAIYPSITLIFTVFGEQLMRLPAPVRTLVITLVLVPLMVFVLLPALQRLFAGWLRR
jgi:antibiotic biosynthesis monooxygenase (ABM) superfamily enzyme